MNQSVPDWYGGPSVWLSASRSGTTLQPASVTGSHLCSAATAAFEMVDTARAATATAIILAPSMRRGLSVRRTLTVLTRPRAKSRLLPPPFPPPLAGEGREGARVGAAYPVALPTRGSEVTAAAIKRSPLLNRPGGNMGKNTTDRAGAASGE